MNKENIVSLALSYYDKQKRKHQEYYKSDHRVELGKDGNDINLPTFTLYHNDKIMKQGVYNIIGFYFKDIQQWSWAWIANYSKKNETYLSRKLLNYALDIDFENCGKGSLQAALQILVRNDLMNPYIAIHHPVQLEQYLALGQYLTNTDMVYKFDNHPQYGNNVTVYAVLKYTDL